MKRLVLLALLFVAPLAPVKAAQPEPLYGHCMSIAPICAPGSRPYCLCENSLSLTCTWVCAAP